MQSKMARQTEFIPFRRVNVDVRSCRFQFVTAGDNTRAHQLLIAPDAGPNNSCGFPLVDEIILPIRAFCNFRFPRPVTLTKSVFPDRDQPSSSSAKEATPFRMRTAASSSAPLDRTPYIVCDLSYIQWLRYALEFLLTVSVQHHRF